VTTASLHLDKPDMNARQVFLYFYTVGRNSCKSPPICRIRENIKTKELSSIISLFNVSRSVVSHFCYQACGVYANANDFIESIFFQHP
jgi:hypothetical protein